MLVLVCLFSKTSKSQNAAPWDGGRHSPRRDSAGIPCWSEGRGVQLCTAGVTRALAVLLLSLQVLLQGVHSSCEEERVRECLRKVQEST